MRPGRPKTAKPLWPKEHGAYGQLGLPLVAALAMGSLSASALLLVVAAVVLFIAHESFLVLLGARGPRAKRDHGARAMRVGLGFGTLALAAGVTGLWLGGESVLLASGLPLALLLPVLFLAVRGSERTLVGEIVAAAALAGAALPVAVAGGVPLEPAALVWGMWVVASAVSIPGVRFVIASHKGGGGRAVGLLVAGLATLACGVSIGHSWIFASAVPMVVAGWVLVAWRPHPRHLKRVGWTLVVCSTLTATSVVVLVRSL